MKHLTFSFLFILIITAFQTALGTEILVQNVSSITQPDTVENIKAYSICGVYENNATEYCYDFSIKYPGIKIPTPNSLIFFETAIKECEKKALLAMSNTDKWILNIMVPCTSSCITAKKLSYTKRGVDLQIDNMVNISYTPTIVCELKRRN